jgi:CheY-like chemotaxis protein
MGTIHTQTLRLMRKVNPAAVCILIVEDNDSSRRLVVELLRAAGFTNLYSARNAEEAVEQMQSHVPDLMLLDWGLPGMSGIELVNHIRRSAVQPDPRFDNPELPIVMLTARQRARDVTQARNAGVNEFVIKPFSTISLLRSVCRALVKKRPTLMPPGVVSLSQRIEWLASPRLTQKRLAQGEAPPVAEVASLRGLLQAGKTPDIDTLENVTQRLMQAQAEAHDLRMHLIAQAMQSLKDYMRLFGDAAEADVLDVHLESLMQLNDMSLSDQSQASLIVKQLETLVAKRSRTRIRKVSA